MSKRLLRIILPIILLFSAFMPFCIASPSYAAKKETTANICGDNTIPAAVQAANGCKDKTDEDTLPSIIINIINVVIGVLGLAAVVFIVIGGISYMTSSGEAAKIEKARKTILYALIGLGICVLAFAIVNFAVGIINSQPKS